jgi:hypothetical protein
MVTSCTICINYIQFVRNEDNAMSLARTNITKPIEVQYVATTINSRLIKAAMLELFQAGGIDAYTAKVNIVRWLRRQASQPTKLKAETARLLLTSGFTAEDIDTVLNELKQNDHFLFQTMGTLMTPVNGTAGLDVYDARDEALYLINSHGENPHFLIHNPDYIATLDGFKTRDFGPLEIDYGLKNAQRLAVVEVLTHETYALDPQKAFDIVTISTGTQLADFLVESGFKARDEKNEKVEERHDHHNFTKEAGDSSTGIKIETTPTSISSSTGNILSFSSSSSSSANPLAFLQTSSTSPAVITNNDTTVKITASPDHRYYPDKFPQYALILLGVAGVSVAAGVLLPRVTGWLQKLGVMKYKGYQTAAKANKTFDSSLAADDELDLERDAESGEYNEGETSPQMTAAEREKVRLVEHTRQLRL